MIILKEDETVKVTLYCKKCNKYYDVPVNQKNFKDTKILPDTLLCPEGHELDVDPILNAVDFTMDDISQMFDILEDAEGKYFVKKGTKYRIYEQ